MHTLESQQPVKTTKVLEKFNKHHTVLLQPGKQADSSWTVLETKQKKLALEVNPSSDNTDHETKTSEEDQSKMSSEHDEETLLEASHKNPTEEFGYQEEEENVAMNDQPEKFQQFPSLFDEDVEEVVLERKIKRFTCVIYPSTQPPSVDVRPSTTEDSVESIPISEDINDSSPTAKIENEPPTLVDTDLERLEVLGDQNNVEVLETKTKELILEVPETKLATAEQGSGGDSPVIDSFEPRDADDSNDNCWNPVTACTKRSQCDQVHCPACGFDLSKNWSKMQRFAFGHWQFLCLLFFLLGMVLTFYNVDIVLHEDSYIPRVGIYNKDDPTVTGVLHSIGERIGEVFASIRNAVQGSN